MMKAQGCLSGLRSIGLTLFHCRRSASTVPTFSIRSNSTRRRTQLEKSPLSTWSSSMLHVRWSCPAARCASVRELKASTTKHRSLLNRSHHTFSVKHGFHRVNDVAVLCDSAARALQNRHRSGSVLLPRCFTTSSLDSSASSDKSSSKDDGLNASPIPESPKRPLHIDSVGRSIIRSRFGRRRAWVPLAMRNREGLTVGLAWGRMLRSMKFSYDRRPVDLPDTDEPPTWTTSTRLGGKIWKKILFPKRPLQWTQESLFAYVKGLAAFKFSPSSFINPQSGDTSRRFSSDDYISQLILRTLTHPPLRHLLTVEAVNVALLHEFKRERMDLARFLFLKVESLFRLPTSTWNIILRACAVKNDLWNFSLLLSRMIFRRVFVDSHTWVSFMLVLNHRYAHATVLMAIKERGLMQSIHVRRGVAQKMCLYHLRDQTTDSIDMQYFWKQMDGEYGPHWLITHTGNTILTHLLTVGSKAEKEKISKAIDELKGMKHRGFRPDSVTMEVFLKACSRTGQDDLLLTVLQMFEDLWQVKADERAHWRLFQHAWRRKKIYSVRAIWVSARLKRLTTRRMRHHIERCLATPQHVFKKRLARLLRRDLPSPPLISQAGALDAAQQLAWRQKNSIRDDLDFINSQRIAHDLLPCLRGSFVLDNHLSQYGVQDTDVKRLHIERSSRTADTAP